MRKRNVATFVSALLLVLVLVPLPSHAAKSLIGTFLPPNNLKIPVGSVQAAGITQPQFEAVMDRVQAVYGPIVAAKGGRLVINRLWDDPTVNASAERDGNDYIINMYGGLARHKSVTQDGMALVACHEVGHHLGGAPKIGVDWATNEGGADYYANLKCLRRLFSDAGSKTFTRMVEEDPLARKACSGSFPNSLTEQGLCVRGTMAGLSVSELLNALSSGAATPKLDTPDASRVDRTDDAHPKAQCRLDTYFQGSLCPRPVADAQDDVDPAPGTCTRSQGFVVGIRPRCWYKPPVGEPEGAPRSEAAAKAPAGRTTALEPLKGTSAWQGL